MVFWISDSSSGTCRLCAHTHPVLDILSTPFTPEYPASSWTLLCPHFGRHVFSLLCSPNCCNRKFFSCYVGNLEHCCVVLMVKKFFFISHQNLSPWNFCLAAQSYSPYPPRKESRTFISILKTSVMSQLRVLFSRQILSFSSHNCFLLVASFPIFHYTVCLLRT